MRLIPRIDRDPRIVAFTQTPAGKAVALAVFAALLAPMRFGWFFEVLAVLILMTLFPNRRRILLSLGFVYFALVHPIANRSHITATVAKKEGLSNLNVPLVYRAVLFGTLAFLILWLWLVFSRSRGSSLPVRRPLLTLYLFHAALLLSAALLPLSGLGRVLTWTFVAVFAGYLWYFSYALLDRNSPDRDPIRLQVGTLVPFWNFEGASTTYGKGAAYLRKIEAKSPEELAVCQLKAIKLLAWSIVLLVTVQLFDLFVYGSATTRASRLVVSLWNLGRVGPLPHLSVPSREAVLDRSVIGQPMAWYICWASLIAAFLRNVISVASGGGFLIAVCRMAGFRALRVACRPLQAQTIADFWNRYNYYYKEMLVDFFFYPAFVRYFKRHPRLRVAAATFAAAGFGNMMAEFFRHTGSIIEIGLWRTVFGFRFFAFQALMLSTGITISQLRGRRRSPERSRAFGRQFVSATGVAMFYCLLGVFDDAGKGYGLRDHFRFLFHLFGIG
jgi:hypothetical protein